MKCEIEIFIGMLGTRPPAVAKAADSEERVTRLLSLLSELRAPNQKELARELAMSAPTLRTLLAFVHGKGWIQVDAGRLPHKTWELSEAGHKELSTRQSIASALGEANPRRRSRA